MEVQTNHSICPWITASEDNMTPLRRLLRNGSAVMTFSLQCLEHYY